MLASSIPTKIPEKFATSVTGSLINAIPTTTGSTGYASWAGGFTSANDTPLASGGVPPRIQDMNGLFQAMSAWNNWQCAGGVVPYDSSFSSIIGGYPAGAVLATATASAFYVSTVDNNTSNPTTGGANWLTVKLYPVFTGIQPILGGLNTNLTGGGGTNMTYSFSLNFTAPCAGFAHATSIFNYAQLPAAGSGLASGVILTGPGVSNAQTNGAGTAGLAGDPLPGGGFATCACAIGTVVTATFSASTNSVAPMAQFQQNGLLVFLPAP